ncbi:MAG TPA: hypothetical protein VGT41_01985 [Candidatus Babeliales bacterium]|nr:hypothetical protein [Candidatus Babeliales bacterium]
MQLSFLIKTYLFTLLFAPLSPLYATNSHKQEPTDLFFYKNGPLSFQGSYEAKLILLKEMNKSEIEDKEQLFTGLDYLANLIKQSLARIIIKHGNIVALFPPEGPTAKLSLAIELTESATPSEFHATKIYNVTITGKQHLTPEEQKQYKEFTAECETLSLQSCDMLLDFLATYSHILHFNLNEYPIALDIELYIRQSKE